MKLRTKKTQNISFSTLNKLRIDQITCIISHVCRGVWQWAKCSTKNKDSVPMFNHSAAECQSVSIAYIWHKHTYSTTFLTHYNTYTLGTTQMRLWDVGRIHASGMCRVEWRESYTSFPTHAIHQPLFYQWHI